MAEMDLLAAQSSIEKTCMKLGVSPSSTADDRRFLRPALSGRLPNVVEQSVALRRVHRPGRRAPGLGQCELFTLPAALNEQHLWRGNRKLAMPKMHDVLLTTVLRGDESGQG